MALPKRKKSRSRKGMRRSHHALTAPSLSVCPQCHEAKLPHFACPACGFYRGKQVLEVKEA